MQIIRSQFIEINIILVLDEILHIYVSGLIRTHRLASSHAFWLCVLGELAVMISKLANRILFTVPSIEKTTGARLVPEHFMLQQLITRPTPFRRYFQSIRQCIKQIQ